MPRERKYLSDDRPTTCEKMRATKSKKSDGEVEMAIKDESMFLFSKKVVSDDAIIATTFYDRQDVYCMGNVLPGLSDTVWPLCALPSLSSRPLLTLTHISHLRALQAPRIGRRWTSR